MTNYESLIEDILTKGREGTEPLEIGLEAPKNTLSEKIEAVLLRPMFFVSILSLIMLGFATSEMLVNVDFDTKGSDEFALTYYVLQTIVTAELLVLVATGAMKNMTGKQKTFFILYGLFAPLRFGRRLSGNYALMYIPFWGVCKANEALFDKMRRTLSTPMLIIALVIVPILLIDMKFKEKVEAVIPNIVILMRITEVFIWIIFTSEFIAMFSVTDEKLDYCKKNWIDLVIILLPLIAAFLTSFSFLRLLRLNQLARAYRVKGVFAKVRQALILADSVQKIMFPKPEKQLIHLKKKLRENKRQQEELERQVLVAVNRYKKYLEKKEAKAEAKKEQGEKNMDSNKEKSEI